LIHKSYLIRKLTGGTTNGFRKILNLSCSISITSKNGSNENRQSQEYIPGIAIDGSGNIGELNNGFIPYLGYFTQIDSKNRIDIKLAYRISENEKLMLSGPEVSVSVFRSRF
jgi:hypothetical protein